MWSVRGHMGLKSLFQMGPEMGPEMGLKMGPEMGPRPEPRHVPIDSKPQHPKGRARQSPAHALCPALVSTLHRSHRCDALRDGQFVVPNLHRLPFSCFPPAEAVDCFLAQHLRGGCRRPTQHFRDDCWCPTQHLRGGFIACRRELLTSYVLCGGRGRRMRTLISLRRRRRAFAGSRINVLIPPHRRRRVFAGRRMNRHCLVARRKGRGRRDLARPPPFVRLGAQERTS